MALVSLDNSRACNDYWQRCVQINVNYWQDFLSRHQGEVSVLDREWETMARGINLGLMLAASWPQAYQLILGLASYMERRGYWNSWRAILDQAVAMAVQTGDSDREVTLLSLSARLWQRQGQVRPMVAAYLSSIRLARRIDHHFEQARACTNLGYFYIEHGRWYRAEVLCRHALCLFEDIKSDHGCAHTENHLGILYTRQGRWQEAEHHLQRACMIWQAMGDGHGLMRGYINLSVLHLGIKQPDKVLFYAQKGLQQALVVKDELEMGRLYLNMGSAYQLKGDLVEAEVHIHRAATIFQRFSDLYGLISIHRNLGVIYLAQKNWSDALAHLKGALEKSRSLQARADEAQTIIHLAEYEIARGNPRQARLWLSQVENLLNQHPESGYYYQLPNQLEKICRSLNDNDSSNYGISTTQS